MNNVYAFLRSFVVLALLLCYSSQSISQDAFSLPRTITVELTDNNTQRRYDIHIQLPRNYDKNKTYPAVYMTDSPYTFPITVGAARYPMRYNKMTNLMFVGIAWQKGHNGALSRQRDYTHTTNKPDFKDPCGEADKHLAFIQNVVIPHIEARYSTDTSQRTYIGNSLGGLFGSYILLNAPNTFKNYILGSPSYWWNNHHILSKGFKQHQLTASTVANVFISVGENESPKGQHKKYNMTGNAHTFYNKLNALKLKGLNTELRIIPYATHETAYPTTAIQGLWWLFKEDK